MTPRSIWFLTIAWTALVLVRFLFGIDLNDGLFLGTFLADGILVLSGIGLCIGLLVEAIKHKRFGRGSFAVIPVIIILAVGWLSPSGHLLSVYSMMFRHQKTYEAEVERIRALSREELEQLGRRIEIDEGPPVRIAFSWGGMLDNWHGVVHDPSGEVLKAKQFKKDWSNWDDPDLRPVKRLFGGDMRSARHLWGDWYYCAFT